MKTARRLLALLLVAMMVFALVACSGSEDVNTTTDTEGGKTPTTGETGTPGKPGDPTTGSTSIDSGDDWEQDPAPTLEDFNGKTYIVIQHGPKEEPFGYTQDSLMGAHVADRIVEVQNKYGCTLDFSQVAYNNDFASNIQGLMYAEDGGDMVFSYNNAQLRKALGTGGDESAMQDLLAIDNIINFWNFDKWGNITSRETMMAGGTFYGVTPALWVDCTPLPYYQMVYNKTLAEQFGITDPQELWEKEEWDRDNMLDLITECYDDAGGVTVWGISATLNHMVRGTALTAGIDFVEIENINADGTVDWTLGLVNPDVTEALQWLKNTLKANGKYFNNGKGDWTTWDTQTPFIAEQCVFCLTRPSTIFGSIVTSVDSFGIITWAGADANTLTGYYENCYSIAIPVFAKDVYQSGYLIYDLFEGLDGVETYEDVIKFYRETYFDSDIDVECLVREGASLQYSYWPNGLDSLYSSITTGFESASSIKNLIEKNEHLVDTEINTHLIPNVVKLEQYRQNGFFN